MIRVLNSVLTHKKGAATLHREWANNNPRNLLAASKIRSIYHHSVEAANGNAAGCQTWVEIDGKILPNELLPVDLREAQNVLGGLK